MRIEWNEECIHEDDPKVMVMVQYLKSQKYNPDKTGEGAWMQYFKKQTEKRIDRQVNSAPILT